jgi:hypothetical protein
MENKKEIYEKERQLLFEAELDQSRQFDKNILALASGSFALSLLFIQQVAPNLILDSPSYLIVSWTAFISSILLTLISFLISQQALSRQREILDLWYTEDKNLKNGFIGWIKLLNWLSMLFFISGVICLAIFCFRNLFFRGG